MFLKFKLFKIFYGKQLKIQSQFEGCGPAIDGKATFLIANQFPSFLLCIFVSFVMFLNGPTEPPDNNWQVVDLVGHVAKMEEDRSTFKILIGEPTGRRPLGRPRRRWEDNIRMDLKEIGINTMNWVDLAQDRDF